jgi:hypothetical protein
MHHAIFIEGLPGSGKTTFARRLAGDLKEAGHRVIHFVEGDLHPLDLAWCARMTDKEFDAICQKYPTLAEELRMHSTIEEDIRIVAYTRVRHPDTNHAFYDDLEQYEIYKSDDAKRFLQVHHDRWRRFNESFDKDAIYVFECIFLQNHINELILKHDTDFDGMTQYFQQLAGAIRGTNPLMVSIRQMDIETTLNRWINERRSTDPSRYRDWIDSVNRYLEGTRHGHRKGFVGEDGMLRYCHHRQALEQRLLDELDIDVVRFDLDQDYNAVYESIRKAVWEQNDWT